MRLIFINFLLFLSAFGENFDFNSIKSDFVQTITSPEGALVKYEGSFYAKKPNQALWQYKKPIDKSIYYLHEDITIIEPQLEQVIKSKVTNIPDIPSLLKNSKKDHEGNTYTMFDDTKYIIKFKDKKLSKIEYIDKLENSVNITFTNPEFDTIIDNDIFHYHIPSNYDIVRD